MEIIQQIIAFLQGSGAQDIFAAYLMILGGLKVISRTTPFAWDDAAVEILGKPVDFLKKILGDPSTKKEGPK